MYDFPESTDLQAIIAMHYEARKIVSAVSTVLADY